ncbi:MAG: beta-N-acetylhexosaminidase [Sphingomonadaceae bacterium]|uniref:beta-N-acetylhexosaminidase n=1 Tax=Thermaurantiacus sp. TaxID=2820283 RepID=UPI00298EF5E0|nr:beta-N-acetylhexosaminidase [Thermaurantiacus sp.]MCS6987115.1 beta-N-acetylhexosaminidase [Sphingomonadaceae bacterium]MDW8415547.1 beta-N-acetylhexosaminidase [Thermaurantiacus sp.]
MIPAIVGLAGPSPTDEERRLFARLRPAGFILFARNLEEPDQVRALTAELRALAGRDRVPILIDQEGGRVARLAPPRWPAFPPAARFGAAYAAAPATAMAAARANAQAIGTLLTGLGITVNCLPVLDVPQEGAHDVIGDRAFATDPLAVAALGRAVLDGLQAAGVVGVIKHVPGHGRATADSHVELPIVSAPEAALETDLLPFHRLRDAPMAMTAHVLYPAWDAERSASVSPTILSRIVRGRIGFAGLLVSDDIGMQALAQGPDGATLAARARAVVAAGCDLALHCSGDVAEAREVLEALPPMSEETWRRLAAAMAWAQGPARWRTDDPPGSPPTLAELLDRRDRLLAEVGLA